MCAIDQGALRCPYRSEIQNGGGTKRINRVER